MNAREQLKALDGGKATVRRAAAYKVSIEDNKVVLPEMPAADDIAGCCAWLTAVFNLNPAHPITKGEHQGQRGPDGHISLTRADAPPIRFEPATKINTPGKLIETLSWRMLPTDGAIHALAGTHCRQIAYVVRMLCGAVRSMSDEQETEGIIGTFMHSAMVTEGAHTTYGTTGQRYEAAMALRREVDQVTGRAVGPARYFTDLNTGEMVIAVSDLAEAARRHVGSSLPRGWLDARMGALGWARITLQGYGQAGRTGRKGPHARINAYRGLLSHITDDQDDQPDTTNPVNT
jgi:hypothetical protein